LIHKILNQIWLWQLKQSAVINCLLAAISN